MKFTYSNVHLSLQNFLFEVAALLREPGYSDHKLAVLDIAEPPPFIYDYATKDNLLFVKTDLSNKAGKT